MEDRNAKRICACPLNGKNCVDGTRADFEEYESGGVRIKAKCRWWERLSGKDPQSEKLIDQWDCAVAWLPITTIEGAQMARQTSAEVGEVKNLVAETKLAISGLGVAVQAAGASIRQGIESGGLRVLLPEGERKLDQ